jgi:hypothetical protein
MRILNILDKEGKMPPKDQEEIKITYIDDDFRELIKLMEETRENLKAKRELSIVITKLEEALMWYYKAMDIEVESR